MTVPFAGAAPAISIPQMREVDRIMTEDLGVGLPKMMENAGRSLAWLALRRYQFETATVLAGPGGNGGGGMVAARHLANRGIQVSVALVRPMSEMAPETALQAGGLAKIGIPATDTPVPSDLIIDAILGYSAEGNPYGRAAELIEWANTQPEPVLSLDLPSGLEGTTGEIFKPCIFADCTMTLGLPKTGLMVSPKVVGALYLADISIPSVVYDQIGVEVETDPFHDGPVVRVV
jgi:NAD(P)H-hydrate epimerase